MKIIEAIRFQDAFPSSRCPDCDCVAWSGPAETIAFQSSLLRCSHCDSGADDDGLADAVFQSSLLRCSHCDSGVRLRARSFSPVSILFIEVFSL